MAQAGAIQAGAIVKKVDKEERNLLLRLFIISWFLHSPSTSFGKVDSLKSTILE
jgi:hypothetical protein